jgi:hypothetical protein
MIGGAVRFPGIAPIYGSGYLSQQSVNIVTATTTIVVPNSVNKIYIYRLFLLIAGQNTIQFLASNPTTTVLEFTGPGSIALDYSGIPWFVSNTLIDFSIVTSTTARVSGAVYYLTA